MAISRWIPVNLTTRGPIDLKKTIESGHSSFPIPVSDKLEKHYFVIQIPESRKKIVCRIGQKKSKIFAELSDPTGDITENEVKVMRKFLRKIFGLDINLQQFYQEFDGDPLAKAFPGREGLRLTQAHDLYESLICSIMTQNNSVWKFNAQIRKIKELMGDKFRTDHFMVYSFPEPKTLVRNKHLLKDAKLGYREEYIITTSTEIANLQVRLEKFASIPTDEAKKELMKLRGIGPKVADMFLLYGLGKIDAPPTDIWIQRGVCKLFFRGREKSLEECREKMLNHYGKWAGLAQLYLFDYMRSLQNGKK